ncbi:hypothetical protein N8J89_03960 [Crossiella sp. CA-258035]|uniref:multiple cyclophane-containing RiPP AmcA n=1 Tax=Crossiella sp. CA-258035 TaxID=2981138 RepID=UPI0024BC82B6|nr:multiple cyclophane-containing RiPP AmcA [Crossiella sp. CA-258035]WHT20238.1 hypothetical protein N8J89_03960 [Crossiella sp. CA-258035]
MQHNDIASLADQLLANAGGLLALSEPLAQSPDSKFDNRPTWDDWGKKGGSPFNNAPAWDNWDKRKR